MSFINPIFLFGLAAAALPVVFHLVRRMKAKQVPFGSIRFLKATPKEVVRKRRLRDVLLMAVRMAIFALLAFAFARPFVPQERLPFVPQRARQSVVLVVDRSMSMRYGGAFDAARRAAEARLAAAPGDEFAVVAFDADARQLTELGTDDALHRGALGALEPGHGKTDFYRALRLADEILRGARHDTRTVVLVSDFQAAGWGGSLENWRLSPGVTFETVDVGAAQADNAYVEAFHLGQRRSASQVALRYDARVAAVGASAARESAAVLSLDGTDVDRQALPALAARTASFQRVAPREGVFHGQLALGAADALPEDDRFFFTYRVAPRPSILVVDAPAGAGPRDAFFLRHAFDAGEAALYAFTAGGPERLAPGALRAHQVVFVANVAPGAGQAAALRDYVEGGGALVLSTGDGADPVRLSDALRTLGVGRAEAVVDARAAQGYEAIIGEVDLRHPVFSLLSGTGAGAILRPRFQRYVRVVPDSGTAVLAAFDSGDPFLVERRVGRGKVLVYASTFNTSWTDFPVNELYVPFVYQLVKYGLQDSEPPRQFTVGDVVPLHGRPGEEWEVRTPGDRVYRVRMDAQGAGFFRETGVPGHYRAAGGREPFAFSVNVDPRESDLRRRDPAELYAAVAPPSAHAAATPEQAVALAVEDAEQRQKLWRYVILLAVALFAFETYYANRRKPGVASPREPAVGNPKVAIRNPERV